MFPRSMIFFLLLSLLMKHSATITYRCDDDQIIVVQNFGNDTIRMHCQKPTLCGFQFLKCHYNHLQSYCGGKTNFVAHLQQSTPISPVIHTCCNLTINEDVQIQAHIGNDCFLYDLPDGSNGTTGEDLEKEDKEGYMLLRNINKLPGQFANFSGYHLRFYLLRNKGMSQNVVKGVERNELGYRITICSIQCRDSVGRRKGMIYENDEKNEEKQVIRDDKHIDLNKKEQIFNDNNLNQVKLTIRNLTDDGQWLFVTWAEWSYKQWSEWSTIHKIELNELDGTKRRNRCGIHETDTEIKTNTEKGQEKSERIKMFMQKLNRVREGFRDCDDDEDYTDELKKNNVEQEEQKLGEDSKELGYDYSKKELAIKSAEKQNFSELDVEENLKSELNSHKINETEEEMDLFVNPVTRREEIENQTKDHFEKMKENTLSDDGNNLKTPTIRATIHCNISITKEVRSGHDDISSIKKTSESEEKDISTIKHRDDVDLMNTSQSYLNEKQLLAEKKKQKDEAKKQTKSSTNDESNFENQTSHATRSSCPCNISTTKEVRTGDDDISNMTKTTESKEENISTTNHRKDDDLMSTTQSHLNTKVFSN
uniref:Qua-1 protein n=1 Tax=Onchocerca volvulus TaxID=6282 RepID=A0A8R1XLN2_ONCVO